MSDMDSYQRAAFIVARAAMLNAEIAAMQAANNQHPDDQPYSGMEFQNIIASYPELEHNNVLLYLRDG